jgi:hypothetical protein
MLMTLPGSRCGVTLFFFKYLFLLNFIYFLQARGFLRLFEYRRSSAIRCRWSGKFK